MKLLRHLLGMALVLVLCVGCGDKKGASSTSPSASGSAGQFTLLAGSELKDIETQLKDDLQRATGLELVFTYAGTLDAIERLEAGEKFDAVWVSHGKYLSLNPNLGPKIKAQEKTMLSPVILGVRASKAKALGWDRADPTWADVAEAARAGKLTFGMTNPTTSNSGFTAVIGLAAAMAANPEALTPADLSNPKLADFFKGQALTSGSSGWLAEAYQRDASKVDGLINYESVLLSLNQGRQLPEPLAMVYPKEGIITADYPLMLLAGERRAEYDKLIAALRDKAFQTKMSAATLRRPINPDATASPSIPQRTLIELPFPGQLATIDMLLDNFLSNVRIPASSRYLLDTSGSMGGPRIQSLRDSMLILASEGGSSADRFARFQSRENIGLIPFSTAPQPTRRFAMGSTREQNAMTRQEISKLVKSLQPGGTTAIYSSVQQALTELAAERASSKELRYYTVVVMTDGENNSETSFSSFQRWYGQQDENIRSVKVFPILFGEGSPTELQALAEMTGGRVFDSRSKPLPVVFKEIRGYQ